MSKCDTTKCPPEDCLRDCPHHPCNYTEPYKCLSCPTMITTGDYCSQCSDTVEDIMDFVEPKEYLVESKSVQKREAVQNEGKIREAFEKDHDSPDWRDVEDPDNAKDTAYAWFDSGYKSALKQPQQEIEELRVCVDDIILQENQSLKEQIKILAHITYTYNPDVDMGEYINSLATEDYQLFLENNKTELSEKDKQIEEIKKNAQSCCSKYQVLLEDTKAIYSEHKDQLSEKDKQIEDYKNDNIELKDMCSNKIAEIIEKDKQLVVFAKLVIEYDKQIEELKLYKGMVC